MRNRCLGVFLIFLAFPFVVLSIIELTFIHDFTSSNFYKNVLNKSNAYSTSSKMISEATKENDDVISMLANNIDETWLKENVDKNLDEFFQFVNGRKTNTDFELDLSSLKTGLKPNSETSQEMIDAIPDTLSFETYKQYLINFQTELNKEGQGELLNAASGIDNQIQEADKIENQLDNNLQNVKKGFLYKNISEYLVYAITLLLLFLIGYASRNSLASVFRWVGSAIIYPSGITAIFFYIMSLGSSSCLKSIANIQASDETKILLKNIAQEVINNISLKGILISVSLFIVALVAIIVSYLLPKKKEETEASKT